MLILSLLAAKIPEFLKAVSGFSRSKMPEIKVVVKSDLRVGSQ